MSGQFSKSVNRLMDDAMSGRLSRREVLKRGAALGLSAPVITMLLRAPMAGAQGTPTAGNQAPGSTIEVPQGLRTDLKGKKITFMGAEASSPDRPWELAAIKKFTDATGIEVTDNPGPKTTDDRLTKYLQLFAAKSPDLDVAMIDVIHPGVIYPYAVDLSQNKDLKALAATELQAIVDNNTVDGKLVGMPWFTDAGILYFRTDLLKKYGLEAPTTWAEVTDQAKKMMDGERAAGNKDFQGFVFQGSAYEGLTCDALEWQVSNGGGTIIDRDGKVTVNNPQAIAAFERAHGWVNTISPTSVTTFTESESLNVWIAGNSAFMRNWPYAYAASEDVKQSKIPGKFDVSILPKGDGPDARNADCLGGWQLMVSKFSNSVEAAEEFVRYMCSPGVQKSFSIERSHLPTIASIYDDPEAILANPYYPKLKAIFAGGAVARPSTVSGRFYPQVSAAYYTAVNQILTGKDATSTVKDLEGKLKDIMSQVS